MGLFTSKNRISPQEAHEIMEHGGRCIVLDVRSREEFKQSRIKGAKLVPLDRLVADAAAKLPDKDAQILIYCSAGTRSAQAAKILTRMGYSNAKSFGGLMNWPYGLVGD